MDIAIGILHRIGNLDGFNLDENSHFNCSFQVFFKAVSTADCFQHVSSHFNVISVEMLKQVVKLYFYATMELSPPRPNNARPTSINGYELMEAAKANNACPAATKHEKSNREYSAPILSTSAPPNRGNIILGME